MNGCPRQNPAYRPAPASSLRACPERARRPPPRPFPTLRALPIPPRVGQGQDFLKSPASREEDRLRGSTASRERGLPGRGDHRGPSTPRGLEARAPGRSVSSRCREVQVPAGGVPAVPGSRAPRCRRSREARAKGQGRRGLGTRFLFVLVFLLSANNIAHNKLNFILYSGAIPRSMRLFIRPVGRGSAGHPGFSGHRVDTSGEWWSTRRWWKVALPGRIGKKGGSPC